MHKFLTLCFALVAAATSLSSPIRDDLAARGTSSTSDRPHAAFVEYLESTGTQYIDTGITASTKVRPMEIGFKASGSKTGYFFGGGDSSSSGFGFRIISNSETLISAGFGWTGTINYFNYERRQSYDTIAIVPGTYSPIFKLNGKGNNQLYFTETYSYTFALFGRNIAGVVSPMSVRIYYAKLGDLDLLPVRVGNEGFMLDTVSGELFANQGTGSFILGPDIAPLEY